MLATYNIAFYLDIVRLRYFQIRFSNCGCFRQQTTLMNC